MSTLERAIATAASAHAGQIDKARTPYILHGRRVERGDLEDNLDARRNANPNERDLARIQEIPRRAREPRRGRGGVAWVSGV